VEGLEGIDEHGSARSERPELLGLGAARAEALAPRGQDHAHIRKGSLLAERLGGGLGDAGTIQLSLQRQKITGLK
jgi:hypothetical protein